MSLIMLDQVWYTEVSSRPHKKSIQEFYDVLDVISAFQNSNCQHPTEVTSKVKIHLTLENIAYRIQKCQYIVFWIWPLIWPSLGCYWRQYMSWSDMFLYILIIHLYDLYCLFRNVLYLWNTSVFKNICLTWNVWNEIL